MSNFHVFELLFRDSIFNGQTSTSARPLNWILIARRPRWQFRQWKSLHSNHFNRSRPASCNFRLAKIYVSIQMIKHRVRVYDITLAMVTAILNRFKIDIYHCGKCHILFDPFHLKLFVVDNTFGQIILCVSNQCRNWFRFNRMFAYWITAYYGVVSSNKMHTILQQHQHEQGDANDHYYDYCANNKIQLGIYYNIRTNWCSFGVPFDWPLIIVDTFIIAIGNFTCNPSAVFNVCVSIFKMRSLVCVAHPMMGNRRDNIDKSQSTVFWIYHAFVLLPISIHYCNIISITADEYQCHRPSTYINK